MDIRPDSTALSELYSHLGARAFLTSVRLYQLRLVLNVCSRCHVYISVYHAIFLGPTLVNIDFILFIQKGHMPGQDTIPHHGKHYSAINEQNRNGV